MQRVQSGSHGPYMVTVVPTVVPNSMHALAEDSVSTLNVCYDECVDEF